LLARKQVEHRAGHARQALEITDRGETDIDAAEAAEDGLDVADTGAAAVEAAGTAAKATEEMLLPPRFVNCARECWFPLRARDF
jgi:hypothetical protein